jgi:hypothetical protein
MRFTRSITACTAAIAVALAAAGCTPAVGPAGPAPTSATASVATAAPSTTTKASGSPSAKASAEPGGTASARAGSAAPAVSRSAQAQEASTGTALAALEALDVKGRAPKTGYDRDQFGPAWADTDHNGCDTRNDILARDLQSEAFKPGTGDCVVTTGVLDDPYTATRVHFLRGQDTSTEVQIDHVVALSDAWQKGAQRLGATERTAFANDPLNLLAVDGPANMQKSDSDAASWLPGNKSFRCDYVARQIAVKANYDLWVTAAEKDAMARVLSGCPQQTLPAEGTASRAYGITPGAAHSPTPAPKRTHTPAPAPKKNQAPKTQAPQQGGTDPRFGSCAKAKAAGYGPYVAGTDAEYHWYRDGDSDGINCE